MENTNTKIIILIALLVAVLAVAWFMFFRPEQAEARLTTCQLRTKSWRLKKI